MGTLELKPSPREEVASPAGEGLASGVLFQNARWFTRVRWVVVGVLAAFGAVNHFAPELLERVGLVAQTAWPWCLAAILAVANGGFLLILRSLSPTSPRRVVAGIIWLQIVVDLAVLTALVYAVGPLDTFIAFAYLFHIVLACIFFAPRDSLRVALLSAALFLTTVGLDVAGILPRRGVVAAAQAPGTNGLLGVLWALSATFIWLVIWYLASTMSSAIRRRDRELSIANQRLRRADKEKTLQILRVTHDLKAPFSGIESNIQMLRYQHWDETSEAVRELIRRIENRAMTLRHRIKDILALGELRTGHEQTKDLESIALRSLLETLIEELDEKARQQEVTLRVDVPDITVYSHAKQLGILFSNLIANAIVYSRSGGVVEITADREHAPRVRIVDHGIGISAEALPHIFEDYYRSKEAATLNRQSTGLGLAIVRQIARNLKLVLRVDTEQGRGTTFEVRFPPERSRRYGQDQTH